MSNKYIQLLFHYRLLNKKEGDGNAGVILGACLLKNFTGIAEAFDDEETAEEEIQINNATTRKRWKKACHFKSYT